MTVALGLCGFALAGVAGYVFLLRARAELVARAEHELRGPAMALTLAVERMRREPAGRRYARALDVELERLGAGLADLAAARHGSRRADRPQLVDIESFARRAAAGWRPALQAGGREVRVDWRAGRSLVQADRGRLAQALGNLLANATEHGAGDVELRGRPSEGGVRVEVRSQAVPWARQRPAPARRGLGLGIASAAVESAGGRLRVEGDQRVTVASLELPAAQAPTKP